MELAQIDRNVKSILRNKESAIAEKPQSNEVINPLNTIEPDVEMAKQFLSMLSTGQDDTKFWFNSWDDRKDSNNPDLCGINEFTLDDGLTYLSNINRRGAAVSVQISKSRGRSFSFAGARAVWVDIDTKKRTHPFNIEPRPHIIVESSPEKYHAYWLLSDTPDAELDRLLRAMADHWGGDKKAAKVQQTMRLPGFYHQKSAPFKTSIIEINKGPRLDVGSITKGLGINTWKCVDEVPINDEILSHIHRNELGDSELFIKLFGDKFLYDCDEGYWYAWDGQHWAKDKRKSVVWAVTKIADHYEKEARVIQKNLERAEGLGDDKEVKRLRLQLKTINSSIGRIRGTTSRSRIAELAAQSDNGMGQDNIQWDKLSDYLPVNNGIVNLVTGELLAGHQADFVRSWSPVDYDPNAECPEWEKFVSQILTFGEDNEYQPDPELAEFVHRLWGYSITGRGTEDIIPMFYGEEGRNGKTTMFETLKSVLGGDLMDRFPASTIKESNLNTQGSARSDLVKIRGRLISWVAELKENDKIDVSQLKELSGGDSISCRNLYSPEQVSFKPKHTVMMFTNKIPKISSDAIDPIWMRVVIIPFYLKFMNEDDVSEPYHRVKIPNIEEMFQGEKQGILNWLVKGAQKYLIDGFKIPERIKLETETQKSEQDTIGVFLSECTEPCVDGKVTVSALYNRYVEWCKESGRGVCKKPTFGRRLPRNIRNSKCRQEDKRYYTGIVLLTQSRDQQDNIPYEDAPF